MRLKKFQRNCFTAFQYHRCTEYLFLKISPLSKIGIGMAVEPVLRLYRK